ncbi:hypothetical protein RND71_032029 [Anisodus tanguticus]|uniref:Uncharacterized protein n=1 Tax=Anisodus tanguticus TaxID=243964 RepID=A0AAE1RBU6_9SOLA|nr:hypothetical protein RND71_032029 [Anisodus tanguticus]
MIIHGGFCGRGCGGDWHNRNDLQEDKPYSGWSKGSGNDSEGWKSNNKGSWSQGNNEKGAGVVVVMKNKKEDRSGGAEDSGKSTWGKQAAGGNESWKRPSIFYSHGTDQETLMGVIDQAANEDVVVGVEEFENKVVEEDILIKTILVTGQLKAKVIPILQLRGTSLVGIMHKNIVGENPSFEGNKKVNSWSQLVASARMMIFLDKIKDGT